MSVLVDRLILPLAKAKDVLGLAEDDTSQDEFVQDLAKTAAEQVASYVNNPYVTATGTELDYPATFDIAVRHLMQAMYNDKDRDFSIAAEKIGAASVSYKEGSGHEGIHHPLLSPYRRSSGL